jgi:hypothetical protein
MECTEFVVLAEPRNSSGVLTGGSAIHGRCRYEQIQKIAVATIGSNAQHSREQHQPCGSAGKRLRVNLNRYNKYILIL